MSGRCLNLSMILKKSKELKKCRLFLLNLDWAWIPMISGFFAQTGGLEHFSAACTTSLRACSLCNLTEKCSKAVMHAYNPFWFSDRRWRGQKPAGGTGVCIGRD